MHIRDCDGEQCDEREIADTWFAHENRSPRSPLSLAFGCHTDHAQTYSSSSGHAWCAMPTMLRHARHADDMLAGPIMPTICRAGRKMHILLRHALHAKDKPNMPMTNRTRAPRRDMLGISKTCGRFVDRR
jgi:hypothetical protein